jgi:hypothetical protein
VKDSVNFTEINRIREAAAEGYTAAEISEHYRIALSVVESFLTEPVEVDAEVETETEAEDEE